ncbi:GapA-binding peptide SR1P [Domibacillus sp. PGB-M46]|nr:GapA-binding peptide SR1P [Domibacillus sp. PGB-M46]MCI2256913.1 GapA-binding peptide SR1P [Domibacillus sp. PGB-M46]
MGTIVCQTCLETMEHFEEEKVTLLYADCGCGHENGSKE